MSIASILGPPRGGRVVRDAREVIREIENAGQGLENEILTPEVTSVAPSSGAPVTTGEDVFSYKILQRLPNGDFQLRGLEIPEGTWEEITLKADLLANGSAMGDLSWRNFSNGALTQVDGVRYNDPLVEPMARMAPLKVKYWFMRAAFETATDYPLNPVVKSLRELFRADLNNGLNFNADFVRLGTIPKRTGTEHFLIHTIEGWSDKHPLNVENQIPYLGMTHQNIRPTPGLEETLYALLGDRDPIRISLVFQHTYSMGYPYLVYPKIEFSREEPIPILISRNHRDVTSADLVMKPILDKGFCRGVIAEEKYFTPRRNGP